MPGGLIIVSIIMTTGRPCADCNVHFLSVCVTVQSSAHDSGCVIDDSNSCCIQLLWPQTAILGAINDHK